MGNTYRYDLDVLKGLEIIAVVLYHAGWCKNYFLGVDSTSTLAGDIFMNVCDFLFQQMNNI